MARAVFGNDRHGPNGQDLSERERTVMELLVKGLSKRELADSMHISTSTVKSLLRALFGKLAVSDRTHLVAEAIGLGLVSPPQRPDGRRE